MTDVKRERIAKMILGTFRNVWCDRESDEEPYFNCSKCEFENSKDGRCALKVFLTNTRYEDKLPPQGVIADERREP